MASLSLAFDILARDRASGTLDQVGDSADNAGGKLAGMGATAKVAMAAVATAVVAGAVKSITAFVDFQGQMNEVFTLLPGISEEAMGAMTGQVKDFSKEFGVLPDQVVPALYQSLSAGVPKDNVFEFLEVAQKAAKGGVTELETAVNGITGVVNAYGSDVIDAGKASDLMFTTVKLGKTTFDELSASLGDVTPLAGSLGVSFEEVSAAMAASTAITGNTAKSTTGLKSLLAELGKEGQIAAKNFEQIAGKSFPAFIKGGGNLAEALELMKDEADASGSSVMDMFGGIEAGSAALQLAGSEVFAGNLEEMSNAAGATEAAFDQMEKGLGPIFAKMKANAAVLLIDIGERLAPIVISALSMVTGAFDRLKTAVAPTLQTIAGAAKQVFSVLSAGDFVGGPFAEDSGFVDTLFDIRDAIKRIGGIAKQAFDILFRGDFNSGPLSEDSPLVDGLFTIRETFEDIVAFAKGNVKAVLAGLGAVVASVVVPAFAGWAISAGAAAIATIAAAAPAIALGAAIAGLVGGLVYAYENFESFRDVVDGVAEFLIGTVWPKIQEFAAFIVDQFGNLAEWVRTHWDSIQEAVSHVVSVVAGVIRTTISAVTALWRAWGDDLMRMIGVAWDFISESVENGITFVRSIIETVLAVINGDWGAAWDGIKGAAGAVWDQIINIVSTAINLVSSTIGGVLSTLGTLWGNAWDGIKNFLAGAWDAIFRTVSDGIDDIVGFFRDLPGKMARAAGDIFGFLWDSFKGAINLIIRGWNALEFKIPGFDPPGPGPKFGGFTLGMPDIPELAVGALNFPGGLALVGERGPELVNLPGGSDVFSNRDSMDALGGHTYVQNIYNPVAEPASDSVSRLRQVARSL